MTTYRLFRSTVVVAALFFAAGNFTTVLAHERGPVASTTLFVQSPPDSSGRLPTGKTPVKVIPLPGIGQANQPGESSDSQQKIQLAQRLIRQRNYEAAERLLEVAMAEDPGNQVLQSLLLTCTLELKHHFKAEVLLEDMLLEEPRNFNLNLMLAEVQTQMGEQEKALASYAVTMYLIPPGDTIRFLQLVTSQVTYGLEDAALYLIDSLRTSTGEPLLLALPRAQVFEKQGKYDQAVDEYFPLLAEDSSRMATEAERRIFAMLSFEGSADETEKALKARSEKSGTARAMRLLATHYIALEDFDLAFEYSLKQDSLEERKGDALSVFHASGPGKETLRSGPSHGRYSHGETDEQPEPSGNLLYLRRGAGADQTVRQCHCSLPAYR